MPRLRAVAGPSQDELVPISVNSDVPHNIVSDAFEGQILAYIKGFMDEEGNVLQSEYFHREDRKGITWSIQVQGRFLRPISADDVLFGNTFDRPLKLPWGSSAALKFMHFVDPSLDHDLASSTKPWALSPLIATMPHLAHSRVPVPSRSPSPLPSPVTPRPGLHREQPSGHTINREAWPTFPTGQSLSDDTAQLHLTLRSLPPSHSSSSASTPLLSRQPSCSGSATGTPDSDNPASAAVIQSFDPSNECVTQPPEAYLTTKNRSKKHNRVSASSLTSLLSTNPEDKKDRKERKRTEKLMRHEQALQELRTAERRRAYFRDVSHRQELVFGPEDIFTIDFCYGFIHFTPTLSLQLPGGISFDLMHYWDGQPVRFTCCERKREGESEYGGDTESDTPWGRVLWCVAIELVPDEEPQPQLRPVAQSANEAINGAGRHHRLSNGTEGSGN